MTVRARQPSYDLMSGSPTVDNAVGEITNNLNDNIVLREFRAAIDNGWSVFDMISGFGDEFHDETGIETSNLTYDSAGDYYSNAASGSHTLLIQSGGDSNGSTTFTDSTGTHTVTGYGDAQHSTAQSNFGTSSIYLDGTGDYLDIADSSDWDFSNGAFTIEAFIYITDLTSINTIVGRYGSAGNRAFNFSILNSGIIRFNYSVDGSNGIQIESASGEILVNTWYHVAVSHDGSNTRLYKDGIRKKTTARTDTIFNSSEKLYIGRRPNGSFPFFGYLEEISILKGTARYTADDESSNIPSSPYTISIANDSIISIDKTANSQPDTARIVSLHEPVDSVTLNTDVTFEVSRDGGTTWTEATMSNDLTILSTLNMLSSGDIDISSQPAGTTMKLKATTANSKEQRFHAWGLQWR